MQANHRRIQLKQVSRQEPYVRCIMKVTNRILQVFLPQIVGGYLAPLRRKAGAQGGVAGRDLQDGLGLKGHGVR